jgi:uncharacterized protein (DUF2267 family)
MVRKWFVALVGVAALVGAAGSHRGRRVTRRISRWVGGRARHVAGRARGVSYRLSGHHPTGDVDHNVLADRVRSALGPLEKRLDLPHVHVMAEDHVILLHGVVGSDHEADEVERAVRCVPGVAGVESYLHVGLLAGDTRPSQGQLGEPPSAALVRLVSAAREAGADKTTDTAVVRAVLATLAGRLPPGERDQLLSHLPLDVRALARPPRRHGQATARVRHVANFVAATGVDSIDPDRATNIVESILGVLRELVPDEAADVAAVLPRELKEFWRGAVPQ